MEAVAAGRCAAVGDLSVSSSCGLGSSSRIFPSKSRHQHWVRSLHPRLCLPNMCAFSTVPPSVATPLPCPSPSQVTLRIWQAADAVCFDVDSTVCVDEGIDALAEFCGAGEAVAAWTARAMGGDVPFEDALAARLTLFKPSMKDVDNFLAVNPPTLSPGIEQLVRKLQSKGKAVYLISGGFRQMIAKYGYKKLVMVGDGATDLEARQAGGADIFVCYGGVQFRAAIAAQADWCVVTFKDLIESL